MQRTFLFCLLAAMVFAALPGAAVSADATPASSTVAVEADGKVMAIPDLATLLLEVETQAPGATAAAQENARRGEALLSAMKAVLAPEDKIQTLGYRLVPVRAPRDKNQPPEIQAYQAVHRFRIELHGSERLGTAIDTAFKGGASQITGPAWGYSHLEELRQQAAVNALENARHMATALAQAGGLAIKGIQKISTETRILPRQPGGEVFMAARTAPPTPIEVGEKEIRAHIQVVFQMGP